MPVDPDRLDQLAAEFFAAAREQREAGANERALELYARAEMLQEWAALDRKGLSRVNNHRKLTAMDAEHRLAISKGRSRKNPLMRAARAAGFHDVPALRDALKGAGYEASAAFLSMVGTGAKKAPPELLAALKKLRIAFEP